MKSRATLLHLALLLQMCNTATTTATTTATIENNVTFGTAGGSSAASKSNSVFTALSHGFRRIDTAMESQFWYNSTAVGEGLRRFCTSRKDDATLLRDCMDDIHVTTKLPPWELTANVSRVMEVVLKEKEEIFGANNTSSKLGAVLIHAPECWKGWHPNCVGQEVDLFGAWRGLELGVAEGLIMSLGVSNFDLKTLQTLVDWVDSRQSDHGAIRPTILQNYFSPLSTDNIDYKLIDYCQRNGIRIEGYSILGTQHITNGQNPLLTHERVLEIASDISLQSSFSCPVDDRVVSPAIVILSWGLNRGINVIPRSNREENIKTLGQLITRGPVELTEKHMEILGGLGRFS